MGMSDLWKHHQGNEDGPPPAQNLPEEKQGDPMIGREIAGRYVVDAPLGKGGMGLLYIAHHKSLKNRFVVKVIRMTRFNRDNDVVYRRFKREARAVAAVRHPNVVQVVDYDIIDGDRPYIIMEYIEGENLSRFMKRYREGLPFELFFSFMKQICRATAAIHQAGIVHRDLKPSNVMVRQVGNEYQLLILDFGLSLLTAPELNTSSQRLTTPGERLGTPYYMAPEQCQTKTVDYRTDIYALGLIAYKILTGRGAFRGEDVLDIIHKQVHDAPMPLEKMRPDTPPELCATIMKAIQKRPEDRYQTADEFLDALPIHQFQKDKGGVKEKLIGINDNGELTFGLGGEPASIEFPLDIKEGECIEVAPARNAFIKELCSHIRTYGGVGLFIDYGYNQKYADTLQALKNHQFIDPLTYVGEADLTAHVDFMSLRKVCREEGVHEYGVVKQADFLRTLGIVTRAEILKQNATPLQAEKIAHDLDRLIGLDQMGKLFKVMAFSAEPLQLAGFSI